MTPNRALTNILNKIKFKKIKVIEVTKVIPTLNFCVNAKIQHEESNKDSLIKIERAKTTSFKTEARNLRIIKRYNLYDKIADIFESGKIKNKDYIVFEVKQGKILSEVLSSRIQHKNNYLFKYGLELATIHNIDVKYFKESQQRSMPYILKSNVKELLPIIEYLKKNKPKKQISSFVHGDFHYGNVLWKNSVITAVIDWEYSGLGIKEADIAWTLVYRKNQLFLDNIKDVKKFLEGYNIVSNYNISTLKWYYLLYSSYFYLHNEESIYKKKLLRLMNRVIDVKNL